MWVRYLRTIGRCFLALLAFAPCSWSQVKLGETTLSASGLLGLGFSDTMQSNNPDLNSLFLTMSGNLTGSYHDSRFLNYVISPYLNQSNLNSNFNSTSRASGVNATANFLSASRTPMQLSYAYAHNSEGTFNVPGQIGSYKTIGNSQDIDYSAAWLPDDLPSIQGSIGHGNSNYEVIGQPGIGTSNSTVLNVGSSYDVWDTMLHGSYTKAWLNSDAPLFGSQDQFLHTSANQGSFQFGASRNFALNSSASVNYAHTTADDTYASSILNTSFNSLNATYSITPSPKVTANAFVGYSSNLSAQYVTSVLGNSQAAANASNKAPSVTTTTATDTTNGSQFLNFTSNYLNYGAGVSYHIVNGWWVNGLLSRIDQGIAGSNADISSTDAGVSTIYSHDLFGGSFGASYALNYFWTPVLTTVDGESTSETQTVLGQNASASYSHKVWEWNASGSATYGRGLTTLLVGYVQDGYSANAGLSRQWAVWNVALSASYVASHIDNVSIADNGASSISLSLGKRRWGVSGNYSRSNGSGFQVGGGIVPIVGVPTEPGQVPQLLMLFKGEAWGAGGTWEPTKRLTVYGSYSHVHYNAESLATGSTANVSNQGYLRAQYYWRQLIFNAGYSYLQQSLGQPLLIGPGSPTTMQTVFFGVSRRFDFF